MTSRIREYVNACHQTCAYLSVGIDWMSKQMLQIDKSLNKTIYNDQSPQQIWGRSILVAYIGRVDKDKFDSTIEHILQNVFQPFIHHQH